MSEQRLTFEQRGIMQHDPSRAPAFKMPAWPVRVMQGHERQIAPSSENTNEGGDGWAEHRTWRAEERRRV